MKPVDIPVLYSHVDSYSQFLRMVVRVAPYPWDRRGTLLIYFKSARAFDTAQMGIVSQRRNIAGRRLRILLRDIGREHRF